MVLASKRASIGGVTSSANAFTVGLHTDQQSLILGEMMTARNKLQEENQTLRDKLQDANMMIRLLQLKLSENNIDFDITKETGIAIEDTPIHGMTSTISRKSAEKARPKTSTLKKEAFRNQVAPGKKTFESKATTVGTILTRTSSSGSVSKLNRMHQQQPSSPPKSKIRRVNNTIKLQKTYSSSPDSRQAEPEEQLPPSPLSPRATSRIKQDDISQTVTIKTILNQRRQSRRNKKASACTGRSNALGSTGNSVHHKCNSHATSCFGEEQFPGNAQQMRSVVGKLAQVVINEYSTTEDDDNEDIIFE